MHTQLRFSRVWIPDAYDLGEFKTSTCGGWRIRRSWDRRYTVLKHIQAADGRWWWALAEGYNTRGRMIYHRTWRAAVDVANRLSFLSETKGAKTK